MDWQISLIKLFLYINQVFEYELCLLSKNYQ